MNKPTTKDHARQAALHSFDVAMFAMRAAIHALEPYQDTIVRSVNAAGQQVVSPEVWLQGFAKGCLSNIMKGLAQQGFMGKQ
jgi:hypothetical protein